MTNQADTSPATCLTLKVISGWAIPSTMLAPLVEALRLQGPHNIEEWDVQTLISSATSHSQDAPNKKTFEILNNQTNATYIEIEQILQCVAETLGLSESNQRQETSESQPQEAYWLVGWSLGGMLAVALAHRYPEYVAGVITLGSNACFSAQVDWPNAMPRTTFEQFYQRFQRSPQRALKRFAYLCTSLSEEPHAVHNQDTGFIQYGTGAEASSSTATSIAATAIATTTIDIAATAVKKSDSDNSNGVKERSSHTNAEPISQCRIVGQNTSESSTKRESSTGLPSSLLSKATMKPELTPQESTQLLEKNMLASVDTPSAVSSLLTGLDLLGELDNREALTKLKCPQLHLLAKGDRLVPVSAAEDINALIRLNRCAECAVGPGAHSFPVTAANETASTIHHFVQNGFIPHSTTQPQRFSTQ